jgi:hypothetical protein
MSKTLNTPWIAEYFINIAEKYGSNISSVPIHLKPGKKVQLIEASRELYRFVVSRSRLVLTLITPVPHFQDI